MTTLLAAAARRLTLALGLVALANAGAAQDHSRIYSPDEIAADADRLQTAIGKMQTIFDGFLTPEEKAAAKGLVVEFPTPLAGDPALNFYAFSDFGEKVIVMPLMSLKMLEDVTTAYAYLLTSGYAPGAIDLYFTMIGRKDPSNFPGARYPALLPALGVPADAWKRDPVGDLSLRLRNEAFAFAYAHELGHVVLKHRGLDEISAEQALDDEIAADRFALDLLARTETSSLGAVLLFQAQAYSLSNRGQFESDAAWEAFLRDDRTHPMTTERLRAFADHMERAMASARSGEREIWRFFGDGVRRIAAILEDRELQDCMALLRDRAPIEALAPRRVASEDLFRRECL